MTNYDVFSSSILLREVFISEVNWSMENFSYIMSLKQMIFLKIRNTISTDASFFQTISYILVAVVVVVEVVVVVVLVVEVVLVVVEVVVADVVVVVVVVVLVVTLVVVVSLVVLVLVVVLVVALVVLVVAEKSYMNTGV